jgi:hypothetical protein
MSSIQATLIKDLIYTSIFYFKLNNVPYFINSNFQCQKTIFYHLTFDHQGRENFYYTLIGASSFFLIFRRLVAYIEFILKGVPLFKQCVYFTAESIDKEVYILIKGITSKLRIINKLPKILQQLVIIQNLNAPFGCTNYQVLKRPLLSILSKHK